MLLKYWNKHEGDLVQPWMYSLGIAHESPMKFQECSSNSNCNRRSTRSAHTVTYQSFNIPEIWENEVLMELEKKLLKQHLIWYRWDCLFLHLHISLFLLIRQIIWRIVTGSERKKFKSNQFNFIVLRCFPCWMKFIYEETHKKCSWNWNTLFFGNNCFFRIRCTISA